MRQWPEWRRERMWELWGQGHSIHAIARELGVFRPSVTRYLNLTGGVGPQPRRRSKLALSVSEREEISRGLARGESFRAIARQIGRPHTTVSREVGRNGGRRRYRARRAEAAAWRRARRPKPSKLAANAPLRAVVCDKLRRKWSPEQIAAWLARSYGDDPGMRVSHETIYLSLFVQSRGALRRELCDHLRSGRRLRRPPAQRSKHQGQGQIPDKVMISERPAEASDRAVPGHWEGDLLLGRRPTGVATLVERQTHYCQLVALPDGHAAAAVRDALMRSIGQLPEQLRRSLTWDQGKEMLEHVQFTVDSGVQIYFCDPRSPWQRGSNENTNGLLRQYLPKRTDLNRFTQRQLDAIAQELNGRPRETLGWATPAERLAEVFAQTPQS
jgi:IS30 family transposase